MARIPPFTAALIVLLLAGCGGESTATPQPTADAEPTADAQHTQTRAVCADWRTQYAQGETGVPQVRDSLRKASEDADPDVRQAIADYYRRPTPERADAVDRACQRAGVA